MELELNKSEIEAALLEYAESKFPGLFNYVRVETYRATFSKVEPEAEPTKVL